MADNSGGEYLSDVVVSDLDSEALERLPPSALHRSVDLLVCKADAEGYVRAYIVLPTAVFGSGEGPLYDAGISKRSSVLVTVLASAAADRGHPGIMGTGKNAWGAIHVEDSAYPLEC